MSLPDIFSNSVMDHNDNVIQGKQGDKVLFNFKFVLSLIVRLHVNLLDNRSMVCATIQYFHFDSEN